MWIFIKLMIVLQYAHSLRITSVRIPEVLQHGSRAPLTLDCDFVTDNVTGLVVQWFRDGREHLVYQWIPPNPPQALGILRDKLDLSYKASNNPHTWHRALRVRSPEPELTGNYTCVVSTFLAEDERTRPMTIFVPERRFDMVLDRLSDGYLNVICAAEGMYPAPELTIIAAGRPLNSKSSVTLSHGRYTALTSAVVSMDSLPPAVEMKCDLQVPLANYYSMRRDVFYRDPPVLSRELSSSSAHSLQDRGHTNEMKIFLVYVVIYNILLIT
ncbi:uncharacterized protein LOC121729022 [Aricia agestis]|uniref:uncharacterized protein LOC121729022 n=1 Tax=Aricia agestis TaxID=91739 RepID=UPI001C20B837|nr:uncharacterized protein LOC121729022 [Aricia agestis]